MNRLNLEVDQRRQKVCVAILYSNTQYKGRLRRLFNSVDTKAFKYQRTCILVPYNTPFDVDPYMQDQEHAQTRGTGNR